MWEARDSDTQGELLALALALALAKDSGQLVQSRVQTKNGEAAWNKLPVEIKLSPNEDIFKSRFKSARYLLIYLNLLVFNHFNLILIILFLSFYILVYF